MDLEIGCDHPVAGDCRFPSAGAFLACLSVTTAAWAMILMIVQSAALW